MLLMNTNSPISDVRLRVLKFIASHVRKRGYAPSFREVADQFGWASTNASWQHLKALQAAKLLTWTPGLPRTFRLTPSGTKLIGKSRHANH